MKAFICGGGIAGLTLAWCLHRKGHQALLIEQAPYLRDEGYMLDFFGSGFDVSERLGLLPALDAIHAPVENIVILDGNGRQRVSVPYRARRSRIFGDRHFNFMHGDLERVLYTRARDVCEIRFRTTITSIAAGRDSIDVRLSDGTAHQPDLLVGADGVHSLVRRLAFGVDTNFARPLGYYVAAYVLDRPWRSRDPGGSFVTITVPNRQVSIYPVRDDRVATFFLHRAERIVQKCSVTDACRELRSAFGDLPWVVPELLDHCADVHHLYFDEVEQIRMPRWHKGRVVLVGDACQCVSPLGGQGASMAMTGAYVLAEELCAGTDVSSALDRYQARVRPLIERQQKAARRMAGWFVPATAPRVALRNLITRMSVQPVVASIVRRRMAAQSVFQH